MKKCLVLVLAMVLAGFMCCGAYAAEYWEEGNDGDSWETAYVIDSAEDFMLMRRRSGSSNTERGKYYRLTTDLDLSSLIGNSTDYYTYSFYGHLDGQKHTVQINIVNNGDMTIAPAIFNLVSTDSIAIRNLNVTGSIHTSDSGAGGGIADILQGGIIENCTFTGTIEGTDGVGGIVGFVQDRAVVRNCTFSGNITVSGQSTAIAGGIAASVMGGSIENCSVLSGTTITCNVQQSTENLYAGFAGGIAGQAITVLKASSITNCTSYAALDGNASWKGGIVGSATYDDYNYMSGVQNTTLSGNTWPKDAYLQVGNTTNDNSGGNSTIDDNPVSPVSEDAPLPEGIIQPVQLSDDVLEKIAGILSVDTSEIHYISYDNIAPAEEPSQAMKDYVKSDGHQITGKLGVISVDTQGVYVVKVILTDELFERLKSQNVADFKLYALSDAADAAGIDSSFLLGFLNTWEILTLSGEKMETFGAKEFLMTGVLNAGTPFSVYIARILLMLLAGGCNSGIGFMPGILIIAFIATFARIPLSSAIGRKRAA